jgi:succinate dehydrogenase / fumarate reductase, cytochrome b subunit
MKWSAFFTSAVGKKLVMGLTGLFLVVFLIVHVGINACIWAGDDGVMFNKAAHFMSATVLIRIMEVGLFIGFIIHIVQGLALEFQNRAKRGVGYAVNKPAANSKWYSRAMGLLGTLILLFLVLHLKHFWVPTRFGNEIPTDVDGKLMHNLYGEMLIVFKELWIVLVYVAGCISLAWHLLHGFQSAFRTLGLHNSKYLALVETAGIGFSIIVPLAFAMMPVSMYLGWVK